MDTWLLVFLGQDELAGTREERKKIRDLSRKQQVQIKGVIIISFFPYKCEDRMRGILV